MIVINSDNVIIKALLNIECIGTGRLECDAAIGRLSCAIDAVLPASVHTNIDIYPNCFF